MTKAVRKVAVVKVWKLGKIKWIKGDNCFLLFAIWETLTSKQQGLLTVSGLEALIVDGYYMLIFIGFISVSKAQSYTSFMIQHLSNS